MAMELTKSEEALINAVRDLNEAPFNILLWYAAGLEEAKKKIEHIDSYRAKMDQRSIDIANKHMRGWHD